MKNTEDEILFNETAFRKDTVIQIVHKKELDTINMIIIDSGNTIIIPFNLTLFNKENNPNNVKLVLNNINRANVIGRAGLTIKNFLKKTMFKKLLDNKEITQEEYEQRMGDLINKI